MNVKTVPKRKACALDVQVAYDVLTRACVSDFNAGVFVSPVLVPVILGDKDGMIEVLDGMHFTDANKLLAPGKNGPVMDEFFYQALTDKDFRQGLEAAGQRAADILVFLALVNVYRDGKDKDALMIRLYTAERSFRSMLTIEGPEQQVYYEPLQLDLNVANTTHDVPETMSLASMASSLPFLIASHPLHDLHIRSNAALH